jgi:hypothetical protein
MNEPEDDTTEPDGGARPERNERDEREGAPRRPRPGAYYYDDATGYEPYDPATDEAPDAGEDEASDVSRDDEGRDS